MNFWKNVDTELKYLGITRKELANAVGFNISNISNGIRDNNIPSAETALQISSYLGVSLQYLLTGNDNDRNSDRKDTRVILEKFRKYRNIIDALEKMPEKMRDPIIKMILSINK